MPAVNRSGFAPQDSSPADSAAVITPHDTTELTYITRALYVGGAGNLTVLMESDEVCLFSSVPAGTILPIRVKRVNSTATSATTIVGLY